MANRPQNALAGLLLDRSSYAGLTAQCPRAGGFPTWAEWNKLQIRATAAALKRGENPVAWTLDPDEFNQWCKRVGVTPCLDGLRAYAHVARHDPAHPDPSPPAG